MPTILMLNGWRFFFYANENNEPPHVHCKKGSQEAKFWLRADMFDVSIAFSFDLSPANERFLRKVIFEHFDYLLQQWYDFKDRSTS